MTPIVPISTGIPPIGPISGPTPAGGGAFQDVLTHAISSVEAFSQQSAASTQRFLSGEGEELHDTVMAAQRAELSFDLFLQMRNKVVSAYQEVMKMQV